MSKSDGKRLGLGFLIVFCFWVSIVHFRPVLGRPLRERALSLGDEWLFMRKDEHEISSFSAGSVTGIYRGSWKFLNSSNSNFLNSKNSPSRFPDFRNSNGSSTFELVSTPTKITGVHYVQGAIIFHDVFDDDHKVGAAQIRVEGVYVWPFRKLRLVANSGKRGTSSQQENYISSNSHHLLGFFSSQFSWKSPQDKIWKNEQSLIYEMEKHCSIEIVAQISCTSSSQNDGGHDCNHLEGLMKSPSVDDNGECFSPILLNATSVNSDVYYDKVVNYTLMVTFISFLQALLLLRQMEHSSTQSGAAKVSILMIGQQAIMDAYLCLTHLTTGILVDSLFNAFAITALFKFVNFAIFEMRYVLTIWKAGRPMNNGEGWAEMRHELSVLYGRFYGILLGGIFIMYECHKLLRAILLLIHCFWIPQIVTNVTRDLRKPLHPHYIIGMTITRLAIPFYVFGCPHNFLHVEPDKNWCVCLGVFMGFQASILLLQHYLGSRWFIPSQILPEKYSYYRKFDQDKNHVTDCVICMSANNLAQGSNDCMVTPCDHVFHSNCLQRWMDIKMECPTCRRTLPPT